MRVCIRWLRPGTIWTSARGEHLDIEDTNTPAPLKVKTNKPGQEADGQHVYQTGRQAIDNMEIANGMSIGLFASEQQFPELVNPVQMSVDPDGRIWVAAWPSYPHWNPKEDMNDKLLILPDDDGDGTADRCVVFSGGCSWR